MSNIYIHPTVFHDCRRLHQLQARTGARGWEVDRQGRPKLVTKPSIIRQAWQRVAQSWPTPDGAA